ncbi:MAG TPA: WD40 repeat domain-containing protein, partial [Planctomycetota bacterium]|nr:WD40 repeat domain-containing protein [Planctomycetota bacterium]
QKLPKGETREVRDVDYSPDGTQLAFVTQHKPSDDAPIAKNGAPISPPPAKAHLADARTGGALCEFDLLPGEARAVEFLARGATLLALSDGGALATGANGAEVWRWEFPVPPTPEREARMIVSAASERALVWSADKRKLGASRAWLLDTRTGLVVCELAAPGGFLSAEFRRDGLGFATGSADGTLRTWKAEDGAVERSYDKLGAVGIPRVLRYSPDGTRLVALLEGGRETRASMLYLASGAATLIGTQDVRMVHAAFSPDGARLATIGTDMVVRLWAGADNHEEQSFRGLFTPRQIEWSADGRRIATFANAKWPCVSVWYAGALPDVYALQATKSAVCSARFAPDGERVVVGSEDGLARVWATPAAAGSAHEPGELLFSLPHRDVVRDAVYAPDGASIATASKDGSARLWSASDGKLLRVLVDSKGELAAVAFSSDSAWAAVRSEAGRVLVCDLRGPRESRELDTHEPVTAMIWLPGRAELVTAHAQANLLRTFRADDGELCATMEWESDKPGDPLGAVALAARADGKEIAVACADSSARFFVPGEAKESLHRIRTITSQSIEYTFDGRRLLVTGRVGKGALRLQDLEQAREFAGKGQNVSSTGSVKGEKGLEVLHTGDVTGGAFSPDGRWMISTAKRGGAYVRESEEGAPFAHFEGPPGASCFAASISPGEKPARALTAFDDGSVWVWPIDPLGPARARKPRELNEYERERENDRLNSPAQSAPAK